MYLVLWEFCGRPVFGFCCHHILWGDFLFTYLTITWSTSDKIASVLRLGSFLGLSRSLYLTQFFVQYKLQVASCLQFTIMDFAFPLRLTRYVCIILVFGSYKRVCSFNVIPKTQATVSTRTSRRPLVVALAVSSKSKKPKREGNAAMGFGSSGSIKRNKDASVMNPVRTPQNSQGDVTTNELDKWGLPPPTIEDIFPKMSKDTEIIPVDPTIEYAVNDIQNYLNDSYPNKINLDYVTTSDKEHDTMAKSSGHPKMMLRLVHCSPPVLMINNFLSVEECRNVQRIVTDQVEGDDNVIRVASKTMSQQLALSKRTSTSWFCTYKSIPTVLAKLQHVLGISDLSRCEEPQIVKYDIGQEFSYHYDILPNEQLSNGGQRVATILIYLNTISEKNGGSTMFRDLVDGTNKNGTLFVQPVQGSALIFFPSNQKGQPDDRTLHRSVPITEDQSNQKSSSTSRFPVSKWILQIWIHETTYAACLPSKQNRMVDAYSDINIASSQLGYTSNI